MATASRTRSTATDEDDDKEPRPGGEVIDALANGEEVSSAEQVNATEWLLSDEPEDAPVATKQMELNVGTDDEPKWLKWTVRSITPKELRRIQTATENEQRRNRGGGTDELLYHAKVVAQASVEPNVAQIAKDKGATKVSQFLVDRFNHKPGLLPQMAAEVLALSGFDDSHVREVEAGKS